MTETVRSSDGTTIAFERSGSGPAVVLVGGALSDRSAAGRSFPDRRGGRFGEVFGHSSGAALALEAVAQGLPIAKLALYEPPFIVDDTRPPLPEDYVEHLDELVASDRRGDAVEYFMTVGFGLPAEMVAGMRESPAWPFTLAVAHTISYDGRVMGDQRSGSPRPLERYVSVTVSTLVMDGGASPPWQRNAARALTDALLNVEHRTLGGQDPRPAPEVLAPALAEFFTR